MFEVSISRPGSELFGAMAVITSLMGLFGTIYSHAHHGSGAQEEFFAGFIDWMVSLLVLQFFFVLQTCAFFFQHLELYLHAKFALPTFQQRLKKAHAEEDQVKIKKIIEGAELETSKAVRFKIYFLLACGLLSLVMRMCTIILVTRYCEQDTMSTGVACQFVSVSLTATFFIFLAPLTIFLLSILQLRSFLSQLNKDEEQPLIEAPLTKACYKLLLTPNSTLIPKSEKATEEDAQQSFRARFSLSHPFAEFFGKMLVGVLAVQIVLMFRFYHMCNGGHLDEACLVADSCLTCLDSDALHLDSYFGNNIFLFLFSLFLYTVVSEVRSQEWRDYWWIAYPFKFFFFIQVLILAISFLILLDMSNSVHLPDNFWLIYICYFVTHLLFATVPLMIVAFYRGQCCTLCRPKDIDFKPENWWRSIS